MLPCTNINFLEILNILACVYTYTCYHVQIQRKMLFEFV